MPDVICLSTTRESRVTTLEARFLMLTSLVLAGLSGVAGATEMSSAVQCADIADNGDIPASTDGFLIRPEEEDRLIKELLTWIAAQTDYDVAHALSDPPGLEFCHAGQTIPYEDAHLVVDRSLRAIYDVKRRKIHLVAPWNVSDVNDQSRLLHELVHDVQFFSRSWACPQEPEWEAYKLQEKWLIEQGEDPDFNWLRILLLSRCPNKVHP